MFTGIVTEVGSVRSVARDGRGGARVAVQCSYPALVLGESIAVDGACLTVTKIYSWGFDADASEETLARTTLGTLAPGRAVNLERALALGERFGGHIVSGHVDAVGRVRERAPAGGAERWSFDAPWSVLRFCAEKGSITIDGTSLTVNAIDAKGFEVMLIPHSIANTALRDRRAGDSVNLEADLLARYVARALETRGASEEDPKASAGAKGSGLSLELLARAGFMK